MDRTQVNLVQVTPDNRRRRVWMVAAPREEAVSLVLDAIPEVDRVPVALEIRRSVAAQHAARGPSRVDPIKSKAASVGGLFHCIVRLGCRCY